jgi:hypothetical protein
VQIGLEPPCVVSFRENHENHWSGLADIARWPFEVSNYLIGPLLPTPLGGTPLDQAVVDNRARQDMGMGESSG